jgi:hypothetical protein
MRMAQFMVSLALGGLVPAAGRGQGTNAPEAAGAPPAAAPVPTLTCAEPVYVFGERTSLQDVAHTFVIRNAGAAPLIVERVQTSCGCTTAALATNVLAPDASAELKAVLSLRGRRGEQRQSITIESNDPHHPRFRLELQGMVGDDVEVQPSGVHFGMVGRDQALERELEVVGASGTVFRVTAVEADAVLFAAAVETIEEGRRYRVRVRTRPPLAAGRGAATLTIRTDHAQYPALTVPVAAVVVGDVVAVPNAVYLVAGLQEAAQVHYLSVYAPDERPFNILGVETPGPNFSVTVVTNGPNRYRVEMQVDNITTDLSARVVRILTDRDTAREVSVPIQVLGEQE